MAGTTGRTSSVLIILQHSAFLIFLLKFQDTVRSKSVLTLLVDTMSLEIQHSLSETASTIGSCFLPVSLSGISHSFQENDWFSETTNMQCYKHECSLQYIMLSSNNEKNNTRILDVQYFSVQGLIGITIHKRAGFQLLYITKGTSSSCVAFKSHWCNETSRCSVDDKSLTDFAFRAPAMSINRCQLWAVHHIHSQSVYSLHAPTDGSTYKMQYVRMLLFNYNHNQSPLLWAVRHLKIAV